MACPALPWKQLCRGCFNNSRDAAFLMLAPCPTLNCCSTTSAKLQLRKHSGRWRASQSATVRPGPSRAGQVFFQDVRSTCYHTCNGNFPMLRTPLTPSKHRSIALPIKGALCAARPSSWIDRRRQKFPACWHRLCKGAQVDPLMLAALLSVLGC